MYTGCRELGDELDFRDPSLVPFTAWEDDATGTKFGELVAQGLSA